MSRVVGALLVALLCLAGTSGPAAGQTDDRLIVEAVNGNADAVRALLNKGVDANAKDRDGETALMKAAYYGYLDVVRALIEKGASIDPKNSRGETALQMAQAHQHGDVVQALQQALLKDPRANFTAYLNDFQKDPFNVANRANVVRAAGGLPSPPPVPDRAKEPFLQATALLQNVRNSEASRASDLDEPIRLLRTSLDIAPWWSNAYYNLSRALELKGEYDDAARQLQYYLDLKPPEADAAEARTRMAVIRAEADAAARKSREQESLRSVRYVSGGARRLRAAEAPQWWRPDDFGGVVTLYVYGLPDEEPFYLNAFRMPNNHILVIGLNAQSNGGAYAGDLISVWDETNQSCTQGFSRFAFGDQSYTNACGFRYDVSVTSPPNAVVTVRESISGASIALPVALLYRGRALKGAWDGTVYQGGLQVMVLRFDGNMVTAARDPNVNAMGLTPISVTPNKK